MDFFVSNFSSASIPGSVLFRGCLLLGLALIYKFTKKDARVSKFLDQIPGPKSYPVVGSLLSFMRPMREFRSLYITFAKEYGSLFKIWLGLRPIVFILRPDDMEIILSSTKYTGKGNDYEFLDSWIGQGVLTAKGDDWKRRRKLLNPTFHLSILEKFTVVFNEQGNTLINLLKKEHADSGHHFDICPQLQRSALNIICETAMGKSLSSETEETESGYCEAVNGMTKLLTDTIFYPWLKIPLIWKLSGKAARKDKYVKVLHDFTEKVLAERKREKSIEENNSQELSTTGRAKGKKPFLDLLLDLAKDGLITDKEICEEVDTFMFAGHDTTFTNLAWTIFFLGTHTQHQKRVQEELATIFGSDISRDITMADISNMKYLEYSIKESLRLIPVIPFFARKLAQDVTISNGAIIPTGVTAIFAPMLTHLDPALWPDPETFNPDRFNPENSTGRHPYSYIPFSAGPRNCIGQKYAIIELKILLAKLFMNYNIQAVQKFEDMALVPQVVFRPMDGILVEITSRNG